MYTSFSRSYDKAYSVTKPSIARRVAIRLGITQAGPYVWISSAVYPALSPSLRSRYVEHAMVPSSTRRLGVALVVSASNHLLGQRHLSSVSFSRWLILSESIAAAGVPTRDPALLGCPNAYAMTSSEPDIVLSRRSLGRNFTL